MQSERGFEYGVKHIISPQSGELTDVLLSTLDIDPAQTDFLLDLGCIYLKQKRLREKIWINEGDYLRVHTKPRRFPPNNYNWLERVIFENKNFVILNKPSALPVHGSVDNLKENVQAYAEDTLGLKLFVTHRLDVPTRGLILYAKTKEFQSLFNALIADRKVTKIYRCRVEGVPQHHGLLTHYMETSPRAPKTVQREPAEGWQNCLLEILDVQLLGSDQADLEILLHTGRTHQIRAQMGFEGHPIVGDHAYGAKKVFEEERIELQSSRLSFEDPQTGEMYDFKLDWP
ncbi:tRNA pseudouridine synthase C [compost metagenome]